MQRIAVDFNTLNSAPEGLVKFPQAGTPPMHEGERVVLYDEELEVEATVVPIMTAWGETELVAQPDPATWRDLVPQVYPLPS